MKYLSLNKLVQDVCAGTAGSEHAVGVHLLWQVQ